MMRHRLCGEQWELTADVFPPPAKTGRPPADRRMVVDAILWIMQSSAPWRDLPEDEFGPWEPVYGLFNGRHFNKPEINPYGTALENSVLKRLRKIGDNQCESVRVVAKYLWADMMLEPLGKCTFLQNSWIAC
jgi:transposase